MVSSMVETFHDMQLRLARTLEDYDTPEFKALDGSIAAVFQTIYRHEPRNAEEARTMVDFFLDLIATNDAGDNIHLIDRVRAIAVDGAIHRPAAEEIDHGAGI